MWVDMDDVRAEFERQGEKSKKSLMKNRMSSS